MISQRILNHNLETQQYQRRRLRKKKEQTKTLSNQAKGSVSAARPSQNGTPTAAGGNNVKAL